MLCSREFRSSAPSNNPAAYVAGARHSFSGPCPAPRPQRISSGGLGGPAPARCARSVSEPEPAVRISRASKTYRGEGRDA